MSRQLRCPNCGGDHSLVNPGITMLVCEYCKTVVYWDADTVLKTGSQSLLPEADTRLFLHATGNLKGRPFEVVGHLRYDYGRGTWDEWYLQMDDGGVAWLSEDERELSLEQAVQPDGDLPRLHQLAAGQILSFESISYSVREIGNATCLGGEGQLPFTVQPNDQYGYVDLASPDGAHFATLEYDEGHRPHAFAGEVLDHQTLHIDEEKPPSTAGGHEGKSIKCPNCAAALEVTGEREVQTLVCEYCGAQNELAGAEARVLGINPSDLDPGFVFEIGQSGTFAGKPYEICGRMLYEDMEGYQTREYLLFNPDAGYLWLAEENGHYVLNQPTQQGPTGDPFRLAPKQKIKAGPTDFQFYEAGTIRLIYVDGALPWKAQTGDRTRYADLIAPPKMLSVESDGQEIEYFFGRYLPAAEVWSAFGLSDSPPRSYFIHPAQPFHRGAAARVLMICGAIFALINLGLLLWSLGQDGRVVLEQSFQGQDYLQETVSQPFTIGPEKNMALNIYAPLANSWLALQVALVNSQNQVVEECEGEIAYYSGVEGGESWSEGSVRDTTYVKAPPPGQYRLILQGASGSGESGPPRHEPLTIRLSQGAVLSRYFIAAFFLAFLFPLFEILRKNIFQTRRWAPVMEDDDDDD